MIYTNLMKTLASKQISGMCRIGMMIKIWGHKDLDAYPQCVKKETVVHVLSCNNDDVVWVFHDLVEAMDKWMVKADTIPEVK